MTSNDRPSILWICTGAPRARFKLVQGCMLIARLLVEATADLVLPRGRIGWINRRIECL